jgi:cytochrome c peroxidase
MKIGNTTQCGFGILAAVLLTTATGCNERKYTTQDVIAELQVAAVASDTHTTREEAAPQLNPRLLRRFKSVSTNVIAHGADDQALVDLGRMLYFENRLSKSGTISCNSCHKLDNYGVDGERTSLGHDGKRGTLPCGGLLRPVLGWSRSHSRGTGCWPHRQPRGDGHGWGA